MSKIINHMVEILEEGEKVLGSPTKGRYMVRRYEDAIEMSGEFFETLIDAREYVIEERKEIEKFDQSEMRIQILEEKIAALEAASEKEVEE